jgi:CBS-domain-containing membrane protein
LAIVAMRLGRCIHPPGGGTALVAVIGGTGITTLGYQYVLAPVLLNALIIFVAAFLVNAPFAWRRYPIQFFHALAPKHTTPDVTQESILQAIEETHVVVDVTAEELLDIAQRALELSRESNLSEHPLHGRVLRLSSKSQADNTA